MVRSEVCDLANEERFTRYWSIVQRILEMLPKVLIRTEGGMTVSWYHVILRDTEFFLIRTGLTQYQALATSSVSEDLCGVKRNVFEFRIRTTPRFSLGACTQDSTTCTTRYSVDSAVVHSFAITCLFTLFYLRHHLPCLDKSSSPLESIVCHKSARCWLEYDPT
jgi:hypothetical protein